MRTVGQLFRRFLWMFKVKDCRHVCLFCKYYHVCTIDGATERSGKEMNMKHAMRSEDTEQIAVVQWAQYNMNHYPELKWLHHFPNCLLYTSYASDELTDVYMWVVGV